MFREIREIKSEEKNLNGTQKEEEKGFMKIKPETNITPEEARNYWDNLFASMEK